MPIHIRDAATDDAEPVAALLADLGYPATPEQARNRLAAISTTASSRALVAVHDAPEGAEVVGLSVVHVLPFIEHPGSGRPSAGAAGRLGGLVPAPRRHRPRAGGSGGATRAGHRGDTHGSDEREPADLGTPVLERLGHEEASHRSKRFLRFLVPPAEWG